MGARVLYVVAISGCLIATMMMLARLIAMLQLATLMPMVAGLIVGIAVADLVAGIVHWACDTWGSEATPWLGSRLIHSFREHHKKPGAMLAHDWIDVNGGAAAVALVAWVGFELSFPRATFESNTGFAFVLAGVFGLVSTSAIANQLHYWAHTRDVPALVKSLQRRHWILSPFDHAKHHRAPHMHGYCISTGWLNRPLDAVGFWRALEAGVTWLTDARPRNDQGTHRAGT